MKRSVLRVIIRDLHPSATLATVVVCCYLLFLQGTKPKPEPNPPPWTPPDLTLRSHLGVTWMRCSYDVPEGVGFIRFAMLNYLNGELVEVLVDGNYQKSDKPELRSQPVTLHFDFIWTPDGGGQLRSTVVGPQFVVHPVSKSEVESDVFSNLDGSA